MQQRYNELLIEQFRTTAGKVTGQIANLPVLLLKTIGAKTGATRTTPLVYFDDGERYLIIAGYQQKTGRRIPVIVLERVASPRN